jgi:hypothetical protein
VNAEGMLQLCKGENGISLRYFETGYQFLCGASSGSVDVVPKQDFSS